MTETVTPAGYNALEGKVSITVTNDKGKIGVSVSIGETEIAYPKVSQDKDTGIWTIKITNSTGYELPSTGGPGTGLFTALGAALASTAGAALTLKKRKESK